MISIDEINKTILDLEAHDTTYATCEKLAWLYVVRDHIAKSEKENVKSYGDSEFMKCIDGCPVDSLLDILDEHMSVVELMMPREYDLLLDKIKSI